MGFAMLNPSYALLSLNSAGREARVE